VDTNEVNKKFEEIVKPKTKTKAVKRKPKREPAKFPELRYLWGVALLGSFVLCVLSAIVQTILESV
jgi:hypothetical protein